MEKITCRKLMGLAQMILPNVIFLAVTECGCWPPTVDRISPGEFPPGTVTQASIQSDEHDLAGCGYPVIYIDGKINGGGVDVWCDFDGTRDPYTSASIPVTLHVDPTARLGPHSLAVQNGWGVSYPRGFEVMCPQGPVFLNGVSSQNNAPLRPGGTATFTFQGYPFLNTNPQVQIVGSDVHVARGPYNLRLGGPDAFDVDITADPNAAGGDHSVYVTTDSCSSNADHITVDASQPPPSPTPGAPPFLSKIFSGDVQNPTHITKFASADHYVSIYFEGTGFGTNSEIVVDSNNFVQQIVEVPGATDPETARTGRINFYLPAGTDSMVTLHVHNLDNDTTSNGLMLILDDPDTQAPVVTLAELLINGFAVPDIQQNSDADLLIQGQNLQGVTEQSFSGVRGLTFSNVSYPIEGAVRVHVHADATAPLSADEVTNLTVTNFDGTLTRRSNPFWIDIVPAPPP